MYTYIPKKNPKMEWVLLNNMVMKYEANLFEIYNKIVEVDVM